VGDEVVYVTVSAALSPQEESDNTLINPFPLPNGAGDTLWVTTGAPSGGLINYTGLESQVDADFLHTVVIDGVAVRVPDHALVLKFTKDNWQTGQQVYLYGVDDTRAEGDRVVVVQHSVISTTSADFDAIDVRNLEVQVRDNDTPDVVVTEYDPTGMIEDGRTLVVEGTATTGLKDVIGVHLSIQPEASDTIVVKLSLGGLSGDALLQDLADKAIKITSADGRFNAADLTITFTSAAGDWDSDVKLTIEARDDFVREDPETVVIGFSLDAATIDANGDFAYPNLRSGTGEIAISVIDDDTAGSVILESGRDTVLTPDDPNTVANENTSDSYQIRLTKAPTDDVYVAVLTDGLADVTAINGLPVSYIEIGGLRPVQVFNGTIDFAGNLLTRGSGSDLGSFVDEGWQQGDLLRIGVGPTVYEVASVSDSTITLTISNGPKRQRHGCVLVTDDRTGNLVGRCAA
jgi:hypothetical protein